MPTSPLHYLNAGSPNGAFQSAGEYPSSPADVDALFRYLQQRNIKKLTLHFHGGLVPEKAGMEIAGKMDETYNGISHPLTVVWETGWLKTIRDQFDQVEKTEIFKQLRDLVLKKVCKILGIDDGARGNVEVDDTTIRQELIREQPFAPYDHIARQRAEKWSAIEFETRDASIQADMEAEFMQEQPLLTAVKQEGPGDIYYKKEHLIPETVTAEGEKGAITLALVKPLASVAIRVIRRFWNKTDHGLYPTVVEEILREFYVAELGVKVWAGIKQKAESMWADNGGLSGHRQHAGRYLLDALSRHVAQTPGFTIDLVGHSAGSIAICHMLKCMADHYPNLLPVRNILFLAPACRTDLFLREISDRPERFRSFRMFTMDENAEKKDQCVPFVYTRSLLYLISGILEDVAHDYILGLAEQLADEKPYQNVPVLQQARRFFQTETRLALSPSPDGTRAGMESRSLKHGDFDNDDLTLRSLKTIVQR